MNEKKMADTLNIREKTAHAFVPGHITGLFRIHDGHENPLYRGSTGAGFSVSVGTQTSVRITEHPTLEAEIDADGDLYDGVFTITGEIPELGLGPGLVLEAELIEFGFRPNGGGPFEFIYVVTGGDAADIYGSIGGRGGVILSRTGFTPPSGPPVWLLSLSPILEMAVRPRLMPCPPQSLIFTNLLSFK